jgi:hypothetical protein
VTNQPNQPNQPTGGGLHGVVTTTVAPQGLDGDWDYPPSTLKPADCAPGQLYRVKFFDGDWVFTIPGDSPDQPVPEYQARRQSTPFRTEKVTEAERDRLESSAPVCLEVRPGTPGFQLCWREDHHRGDHKSQDGRTWSNQ